MLARLGGIRGVASCLADASGRLFLLELAGEPAPEAVRREALACLGEGAQPLGDELAAEHEAARARGDRWWSAREALGLSYLEARVLASRAAAGAARELSLEAAGAARLFEEARRELFAHVEWLHREQGRPAGLFFRHWPGIAARIALRCAAWMPADAARGLDVRLERQLRPDP